MHIQRFITEKRSVYKKLPRVLQVLIVVAAFIAAAIGMITVLPLPEVGIPLLLAALGLLSFEYKWAERLFRRTLIIFENKIFRRWLIAGGIIIVAGLVAYWLIYY